MPPPDAQQAESAEAAPRAAVAARTSSSTASPARVPFTRQGMSMTAFLIIGLFVVCLIPVLRLLGVPALILVGGDWAPQLRQAESRHCSADVISERMLAAMQQLSYTAAVICFCAAIGMTTLAFFARQRKQASPFRRTLLAAGAFALAGLSHAVASTPQFLDIHIAATSESARCWRGVWVSQIARYFFQSTLIWRCLYSILEASAARLRSIRHALSLFTQARLLDQQQQQQPAEAYVVKDDSAAGTFAERGASRSAATQPATQPATAAAAVTGATVTAAGRPPAAGHAPRAPHRAPHPPPLWEVCDDGAADEDIVLPWSHIAELCAIHGMLFFLRYSPAVVPLDVPSRFLRSLWHHTWFPPPRTFASIMLGLTPLWYVLILAAWLPTVSGVLRPVLHALQQAMQRLRFKGEAVPLPENSIAEGSGTTAAAGSGSGGAAAAPAASGEGLQPGAAAAPGERGAPTRRQERITWGLHMLLALGAHTMHVIEPTFDLFGEGRVGIYLQGLLLVTEIVGVVFAPVLALAHSLLASEELEVLQLYQQNAAALDRANTEEEANKAKRRLLRYVMHEVRVPLHSLQLAIGEMEARYVQRVSSRASSAHHHGSSRGSGASAGSGVSLVPSDSVVSERASERTPDLAAGTAESPASAPAATAAAAAPSQGVLHPAAGPTASVPSTPSTASPKSYLARSIHHSASQSGSTGDDRDEQEEAETLAVMSGATEQMAEVLNSVLTLAALEAGHMSLDPQRNSIALVARNMVARMRPWAASAAVRAQLEVRVEPQLHGLEFSFDKLRVTQVLSNLVSNALKAVTDMQKRSVLVSVFGIGHSVYNDSDDEQGQGSNCTVPARVRVEVADTGSGVPVAERPKLFKPFMQVAGCGKSTQSSGLGLAISREILTRHGGTIGYRPASDGSQPQEPQESEAAASHGSSSGNRPDCNSGGSIFWFELPVLRGRLRATSSRNISSATAAQAQSTAQLLQQDVAGAASIVGADATYAQPSQPQQSEPSKMDTGSRVVQGVADQQPVQPSDAIRILIADDVLLARRLLIRALQRGEWHIRGKAVQFAEAGTGEQAIAAVAEAAATGAPFAAVLMDAVMPGCGGYEATATLRQSGYRGVIFGVTGNALEEDQQRFRDAGAEKVLTKPVDVKAVKEALEKALQ